jgi:apolipoprotein N-acyltransferase
MGGTLWILVINILLFKVFRKTFILGESIKNSAKTLIVIAATFILPISYSLFSYYAYVEKENPTEVVVIQPNIDPYTEKFGGMSEVEQMDRILSLARKEITQNTKYVVAPETAIPRSCREVDFENNYGIIEIRKFIQEFPHIKFIIGISTYIDYTNLNDEKPTATARKSEIRNEWYDAFNTAILIDNDSRKIQTYHKSKLVLGVEKLPYPSLFAPLEKFAIDLGGTFGSVGVEKEAHNLIDKDIHIAPVICYESIYGDYVASYVKKGANLIFIITNDGWWKDTPGYKQHLAYARLRAIETRRSIARSANTGTSCFINQKGDVVNSTNWWEPAVVINKINLNNKLTFYTQNGDLLGRIAAAISVLLLLWNWTIKIKKKFT